MNSHSPLCLWDRRARRLCRAAAGGGILYVNSHRGMRDGAHWSVRLHRVSVRSSLGPEGAAVELCFLQIPLWSRRRRGRGVIGLWGTAGLRRMRGHVGVLGGEVRRRSHLHHRLRHGLPSCCLLQSWAVTQAQSYTTNIYKSKGPFTPRTISIRQAAYFT